MQETLGFYDMKGKKKFKSNKYKIVIRKKGNSLYLMHLQDVKLGESWEKLKFTPLICFLRCCQYLILIRRGFFSF